MCFEASKPTPSNILSPTRAHLLNVPKHPPTGEQVFKCPRLTGNISVKPPQNLRVKHIYLNISEELASYCDIGRFSEKKIVLKANPARKICK